MKIDIRQPFFGAWKKYGWPKNTWGVGIKTKDISKARVKAEKIYITLRGKPQEWVITPKVAMAHGELFTARYNTTLLVIPLHKFKKVPTLFVTQTPKKVVEIKDEQLKLVED